MFTFDRLIRSSDCCPWGATTGRHVGSNHGVHQRGLLQQQQGRPLYTPEQRRRRDASQWTMVQGVLAPFQFGVFLVSVSLVLHYLLTGDGLGLATGSVVFKTVVLYSIMITGAIWERDVFGRYLFAPAFFWEDVVSMLVLALHTSYLVAVFSGAVDAERQMWLALAAYASYVINAAQFLLKLRAARLESSWSSSSSAHSSGALGHTS